MKREQLRSWPKLEMRSFIKEGNNGVGCHLQTVQCPKKKKGKYLLMQFSAEATFQALINAEEDRHIVH